MDLIQTARQLHESICAAIRIQRRAMRDVALGLAEMRARKLYKQLGYASLFEYGDQALGFRDGKTSQLATLGDRLPDLPNLDKAMVLGAVGWTTARTIARVATPETEDAWLNKALNVPGHELEELASDALPGAPPPETDDNMDPYRKVWVKMRLDVLDADLLLRALSSMRQKHGDLSASQMMMLMAERELYDDDDSQTDQASADHNPRDLGENAFAIHHRIIEHRCPECDKAWVETRAGRYELEPEEREHIEDDAEIVHADDSSGKPGHVTRTIAPAIRRAVLLRDQGTCQIPGCNSHKFLELHHIKHLSRGGTHDPENLVCLCWSHHSMCHRDLIQLERAPDGSLVVKRGEGEALGIILSIWRDSAEIDHSYLDEFDGPPGKWGCIQGYFGNTIAREARDQKDERTFVPPPQKHERAFVRKRAPRVKYPRGKMSFVYGDDQRPAPFWMEKPIRC